ncbi:hypothetical protein KFE25_001536 [Diacronema lutheri]|uniref:AP2/ERF domain-containing protein n=1 Tax=Diacronema lutheri TaxID=2081491 RepID=A0A8J6C294_DIALT|nr:hypothetical protein KFE25_001536 [Diacronema lutheri]
MSSRVRRAAAGTSSHGGGVRVAATRGDGAGTGGAAMSSLGITGAAWTSAELPGASGKLTAFATAEQLSAPKPGATSAAAKQRHEDTVDEPDTSHDAKRFRGVTARKSSKHPFVARCRFGGARHHLGSFSTAIEAAQAYDAFAQAHGKGDVLNFTSLDGCGAAPRDEHKQDDDDDELEQRSLAREPIAAAADDARSGTALGGAVRTPSTSVLELEMASSSAWSARTYALRSRRKATGQSSGEPASTRPAVDLHLDDAKTAVVATGVAERQRPPADVEDVERVSKYRGVRHDGRNRRKQWSARITIDGKKHYIGPFSSEEEAAREFDRFCLGRGRAAPNFASSWRRAKPKSALTGTTVDLGWVISKGEEADKLAQFERDALAKVQRTKRDKRAASALVRLGACTSWSD